MQGSKQSVFETPTGRAAVTEAEAVGVKSAGDGAKAGTRRGEEPRGKRREMWGIGGEEGRRRGGRLEGRGEEKDGGIRGRRRGVDRREGERWEKRGGRGWEEKGEGVGERRQGV